MSAVRDHIRNTQLPWFFRKRFILYLLLVVLVLSVGASFWTWENYQDAIERGRTIRWKKITEPFALALIPLMLYAIVILLWVAIFLKRFQNKMLHDLPEVFGAKRVTLEQGETEIREWSTVVRKSPDSIAKVGSLTITDRRIIHTQSISHKKIGILVGMENPDLSFSIPLPQIAKCGFGMDEANKTAFTVVMRSGDSHLFTGPNAVQMKLVFEKLGWKLTQADPLVYWVH